MTQNERIITDFSASQKLDAFLQIRVQNSFIRFQIDSISDFVYFYYMTSMISEGVKVSVETFYQADYSNPQQSEFMFAYRIALENHNPFPVKLHRRHWFIFDSNGSHREVEGEGVVGIQPTIQPGENYQYVSGCNLRTEMGRMNGTYQMENLHSKKMFDVSIPSFEMIVPMKNN